MIRLAVLLTLTATAGAADGLMGRDVSFGSLAYDDRAAPIFVGQRHPARVNGAVEYGLHPEGAQNGWDIIPAIIDIRDQRIVITYPDVPVDTFPVLEFNGYVLDFLTECVLFNGAWQNLELSTEPLPEDGIFTEGSQLFIDVSGVEYGPQTFLTIDLDVAPCPLS
ncbi:MAG: hypothetical protein HLUCCA08_00905 [Rhodobacteraceae bacterium HLUCCA08]|nr:MAG: hypothetical protein HLUCCA08_00905 [Rhodobacteraceae bacterium HLUCCA08]